MPLLFFKKKSRTYVRPCHVILLLRQESVRDIELVCDEENIFILENGTYRGLAPIAEGKTIHSVKFPELSINTKAIFEE